MSVESGVEPDVVALFDDDHGRPFAVELRKLLTELGARPTVAAVLEKLAAEAGDFGRVRDGDSVAALRLLALDGVLTELLGGEVSPKTVSHPS